MPQWIYTIMIYAAIAGGGYWYFTSTQETILDLKTDNTLLTSANATQLVVIGDLREEATANHEAYIALDTRLKRSLAYQDRLHRILQKHDLTRLTIAKPGLIENRINDATQELHKTLESDTRN